MAHRIVVPFLLAVAACSPNYTSQCVDDAECGTDLICDRGLCIAQPEGACRMGETRACGPAAVGLCHPGTQRCSDRKFTAACEDQVTPVAESCNGLDDDCDGVVDNGVTSTYYRDADGDGYGSSQSGAEARVACSPPAGFVLLHSDCDDAVAAVHPGATELCDPAAVDEDCSGSANDGCGCSNVGMSQGCCANRGTQVCEDHAAGAMLSVCTVSPTPEFCNGTDDDCDGQTDEQYSLATADGGLVALDAGTLFADGGCSVGIGACARSGGTTCVAGSLSCLAIAGAPTNELCNGVDDDCDGETDEASPSLCAISGQRCSAGACACPGGQTVCGTSCASLGGSCSAGVGACARTGAIACVSGGPGCDAVPGAPVAESCDGVDNDCDGTTDEGVTINCVVDADNDTAQGGNTVTALCPDNSRGAFGFCPAGFVSPAASTGLDCNDSNATVYRLVQTFADADNDTRCAGQETTVCIGAAPPAGRRLSSSCTSTADCDDSNANAWSLGLTRADADADGYCAGVATNTCNGTGAPAGRRFPTSCVADDCDDASATRAISRQVRNDADGDQYCSGAVVTQCGAVGGPNAGTRVASACAGDDCKDTNAQATTNCYLYGGYHSVYATKSCGTAAVTQDFSVSGSCPPGFSQTGLSSTEMRGDPVGTCAALSASAVRMTCGFAQVGTYDCRVTSDCMAN